MYVYICIKIFFLQKEEINKYCINAFVYYHLETNAGTYNYIYTILKIAIYISIFQNIGMIKKIL